MREDSSKQLPTKTTTRTINMKKCRYARVTGVMALLVALGTGGELNAKQKPTHLREYFVRATQYHKNDRGCDHWTRSGKTSTQLRLPCEKTENDPNIMGFVAVDPSQVQVGGLVYEIQTKRMFIPTVGGDAVIDRTSAIALAGNSPQKRKALVFDFYSEKEIVGNYYTNCWVIPHEGTVAFHKLRLKDQKLRLDPKFWIAHLTSLYDSSSNEEEKSKLREMVNRLEDMSKAKSQSFAKN